MVRWSTPQTAPGRPPQWSWSGDERHELYDVGGAERTRGAARSRTITASKMASTQPREPSSGTSSGRATESSCWRRRMAVRTLSASARQLLGGVSGSTFWRAAFGHGYCAGSNAQAGSGKTDERRSALDDAGVLRRREQFSVALATASRLTQIVARISPIIRYDSDNRQAMSASARRYSVNREREHVWRRAITLHTSLVLTKFRRSSSAWARSRRGPLRHDGKIAAASQRGAGGPAEALVE